ncbi:hypothetical protein L7F22_011959 [Adiantum nelumboides]|nr:hypothetical protein [Adiantum nelumboides]
MVVAFAFCCFCAAGVEGSRRKMRVERMTFYVHDIITPTNFSKPSAKAVAGPAGGHEGNRFFGSVVVIDDKVTRGQDYQSKEIGRARGFFIEDARDGQPISVLMAFTVRFTKGSVNGSTLAFFGQDAIAEPRRFLPLVSGTSRFYLCRGAARVQTCQLAGALNSVVRFSLHLLCPYRVPSFPQW